MRYKSPNRSSNIRIRRAQFLSMSSITLNNGIIFLRTANTNNINFGNERCPLMFNNQAFFVLKSEEIGNYQFDNSQTSINTGPTIKQFCNFKTVTETDLIQTTSEQESSDQKETIRHSYESQHIGSGLPDNDITFRKPSLYPAIDKNFNAQIEITKLKKSKSTKIPSSLFKKQLIDASDTINPLVMLPHTKKLMQISGNLEKLLTVPLRNIPSRLLKLYERNCITKTEPNEIDPTDLNLMPLGYKRIIDLMTVKRIVRKRKNTYVQASSHQIYSQNKVSINQNETSDINNDSQKVETCAGRQENVQSLVEAVVDNENYFFADADTKDAEEIVIHEGEGIPHDKFQTMYIEQYDSSNNIDVLLAAANKTPTMLMFCQPAGVKINNIKNKPSIRHLHHGKSILFVDDGNT